MEPLKSSHCIHLVAVARTMMEQLDVNDVRAAFLFGSAAWGDADEASDLDIMLLVDRPAPYREVTRLRAPDILGYSLPNGPQFADLDRCSVSMFADAIERGNWTQRVLHSVVLKDTDDYYATIRARVTSAAAEPAVRRARFQQYQERIADFRTQMRGAPDGSSLSVLLARLALESTAMALVEANDERISLTHFVESVLQALTALRHEHLYTPFLEALGFNIAADHIETSVATYAACANTVRTWMDDPTLVVRLSVEERAWSEFTYGAQTFEEIEHKVASFKHLGRFAALQYYLDGLLLVPIRINLGRFLLLRATGATGRMSIPAFHLALEQAEAPLFARWVEALRLDQPHVAADAIDGVTEQLLQLGMAAIREARF